MATGLNMLDLHRRYGFVMEVSPVGCVSSVVSVVAAYVADLCGKAPFRSATDRVVRDVVKAKTVVGKCFPAHAALAFHLRKLGVEEPERLLIVPEEVGAIEEALEGYLKGCVYEDIVAEVFTSPWDLRLAVINSIVPWYGKAIAVRLVRSLSLSELSESELVAIEDVVAKAFVITALTVVEERSKLPTPDDFVDRVISVVALQRNTGSEKALQLLPCVWKVLRPTFLESVSAV